MKKYTTKLATYTGEELKLAVTVEGVDYPAGSTLMTNVENPSEQFIVTPDQVAADFDEVKPRTRSAATPPIQTPSTDTPSTPVK